MNVKKIVTGIIGTDFRIVAGGIIGIGILSEALRRKYKKD